MLKWVSYGFFVLAFLLNYACVNDLESIQRVTYDPKAPDDVTKNLHIFYTDSGYARVDIYAGLAENYTKPKHVTLLKDGVKVDFYDEQGNIVSTLTSLYGEVDYETGMMSVRDSVQLYNYERKQRLLTENLFWNQRDSSIYTKASVVVKEPDGILFGDGIRTKQDFSTYEFLKPHGKIALKDNS